MHRLKIKNTAFHTKDQVIVSKESGYKNIFEILNHPSTKIAIADYLIFMRFFHWACKDMSFFTQEPHVLKEIREEHLQLLIEQLKKLPRITPSETKQAFEWVSEALNHSLKLSVEDNNRWGLSFLSHSARLYHPFWHFRYHSPITEAHRLAVRKLRDLNKKKRLKAKESLKSITAFTNESVEKLDEIMQVLPERQELFRYYRHFALLALLGFLTLGILFYQGLRRFLPDVSPLLSITISIVGLLLFALVTPKFYKSSLNFRVSPFPIQISLMEEIEKILPALLPFQPRIKFKPAHIPATLLPAEPASALRSEDNEPTFLPPHPKEGKRIVKRKALPPSVEPPISSTKIFNSLKKIRLDWNDSKFPSIEGYLQSSTFPLSIDFIFLPHLPLTRAWSGISAINVACQFAFFYHIIGDRVVCPEEVKNIHQRLIQVGHVVPDKGHTGVVYIEHTGDTNFPGATFKTKSKTGVAGAYRGGLFKVAESLPLYMVGADGKLQKLNDEQQATFHLYQNQKTLQTH